MSKPTWLLIVVVTLFWILHLHATADDTSKSSSSKSSCKHLLGCLECSSAECYQCVESWVLYDGQCVCKAGTGTFLGTTVDDGLGSPEGWSLEEPPQSCSRATTTETAGEKGSKKKQKLKKEMQQFAKTAAILGKDDKRRITEEEEEKEEDDLLHCHCRVCPDEWTSLGGNPQHAACHPMEKGMNMQSFELIFSLHAVPLKRRLELGEEITGDTVEPSFLTTVHQVAVALAEVFSSSEPIQQQQKAKGMSHGGVSLLESLHAVSPFDNNLLVGRYGFLGSARTLFSLVASINNAFSSIDDFSDEDCMQAYDQTGLDVCGAIATTTTKYSLYSMNAIATPSSVFSSAKRNLQGAQTPSPTPAPSLEKRTSPPDTYTKIAYGLKGSAALNTVFVYILAGFGAAGVKQQMVEAAFKKDEDTIDKIRSLRTAKLSLQADYYLLRENGPRELRLKLATDISAKAREIETVTKTLPEQIRNNLNKNLLRTSSNLWTGQLLYRVTQATNVIAGLLSFTDFVFATMPDPYSNENFYKLGVDIYNLELQINKTVTEILYKTNYLVERISVIETTLTQIQQQIDLVLSEIKQTECYVSNANVDRIWTDRIKPLRYQYTIGQSSLSYSAISVLQSFFDGFDTVFARKTYQDAIKWATAVKDTIPSDLDSIHYYLMGGNLPGCITLCNQAFFKNWGNENAKNAYPFDDRQVFYPITAFLAQKLVYQVNGVRMIHNAYNILAIDQVRLKAAAMNESVVAYLASPYDFCDWVLANGDNSSSPLHVGLPFCIDRTELARKVYDNTVQQIEILGQPFSNGEAGKGVRLLLGSDLTPYGALVVADPGDANNQTLIETATSTRYLFPASLVEFDARCSSSNVTEAHQANCSAVGTFQSCSTECGLDPGQEALWSQLPPSILGFPQSAWNIADGNVWQEIRGMLEGYRSHNKKTGPMDTFLSMEDMADINNAFPFTGLSDKPWWIVNQTAAVVAQHLFMELLPDFNEHECSKIRDPIEENWRTNDISTMPFYPRYMMFPQSQCFAASNPTDDSTAPGHKAGPTGIHCSSLDFASLYVQDCKNYTNSGGAGYLVEPVGEKAYADYCPAMRRSCDISMKSSLLTKYGSSLALSDQTTGTAKAACGWHYVMDVKNSGQAVRKYYKFGACGLAMTELNQYDLSICTGTFIYNGRFLDKIENADPLFYLDMRQNCSHQFSFPWFNSAIYKTDEQVPSPYQNFPGYAFPSDSKTRRMFRLPVLDINDIQCTPSPFINAGHVNDPSAPRSSTSSAGFRIPCNDLMTQAVVSMVGSGYYSATSYGNTANLKMAADGDTITCDVHWTTSAYTKGVYITAKDDENGNSGRQVYQNVSLRKQLFFNQSSNSSARIISCTVVGVDYATGLSVGMSATSKIIMDVNNRTEPWKDFSFPIYTNPLCLKAGCITSILSEINQPIYMTVGRASNWPAYANRTDTIFVAVKDAIGMRQISPPADNKGNFSDVIYQRVGAPYSTALSQFESITNFQVDDKGVMYISGERADQKQVINRASWSLDGSNTSASYLGDDPDFTKCGSFRNRSSNRIGYLSLDGSWRHPITGDVYVVDGGCGSLYRIDASAFNPSCKPFGSCGRLNLLSNLTGSANMVINEDGSKYQNVSLVGDVKRGILYAAYGRQCSIMSLNMTTGGKIEWVVASSIILNGTSVLVPLCGYSGDGRKAAGGLATLSSDIRQIALDPTSGDLYIADTGNFAIRMVSKESGNISTVAGIRQGGYTGDGGQALAASLWEPSGIAVVAVNDSKVMGGFRKALNIADTSNNAIRRVLLTDFVSDTPAPTKTPTKRPTKGPTAPTKSPSRGPTSPTRRPTVGKVTPKPNTKSPSKRPSPAPTTPPTRYTTQGGWVINPPGWCNSCTEEFVDLGSNIGYSSKYTCTCGISSPHKTKCYSSCCPLKSITYDPNSLVPKTPLECADSTKYCRGGINQDQPCPLKWFGSFSQSCDCKESLVLGSKIFEVTCQCAKTPEIKIESTCYSSCCPTKTMNNTDGILVCQEGSCLAPDGGPC